MFDLSVITTAEWVLLTVYLLPALFLTFFMTAKMPEISARTYSDPRCMLAGKLGADLIVVVTVIFMIMLPLVNLMCSYGAMKKIFRRLRHH